MLAEKGKLGTLLTSIPRASPVKATFLSRFAQYCQRFDTWYQWPQDGQCYKQWRQGKEELFLSSSG